MYPSPRVRDSVTPPTRGYKPRVPIGTVPTTRFRIVNWLLLVTAMLINGYAINANAADKVTICHKSKNTLSISGNALQAHLNHGDTEGACENSDTDGALSIEPTSHDFGSVNLDKSSADKPFTIVNESDNSLTLGFIDELASVTTTIDESGNVTTAYSKEFRIITDKCSNTTMAEKYDTCELAMVFEPKDTVGTRMLDLFVPYYADESGNPNSLILPLTGEGVLVPIPNIESSIMSHDFGDVEIGKSSDEQFLRISNSGEADLVIGQLSLSNTGDFNIILDLCSGITVSPTQNCSVRTQFTPQSEGAKTATLSIPSDDPDTPTLDVSFTGNGIIPPMPDISVEPMPIDIGEVRVGNASGYQTISVYNIGNAPLKLGQITSLAGSEFERLSDIYSFIPDRCSNYTISPSKRCIMNVRLNPQSLGAKTATLSIPSDDPDMPTVDVALNGTAVGWCQGDYPQDFSPYPEKPDFGTIPTGTSASINQSINTWAEGCGALKIVEITVTGTNASEFAINNKDCNDGSDGNRMYSNCRFDTVFSPASLGNKSAELLITFNDTTTKTIPLLGNAVTGAPNIVVTPISKSFGTVVIGHSASSHQYFYVKNTGNVNLKLSDGSITGTHKSDFAFEVSDDNSDYRKWGRCFHKKTVLSPGDQCVFGVVFAPISSAGSKQANVTIVSNDPDTKILDVALTGTAIVSEDCSDADVTIETVKSGYWATLIYNNGQMVFEGPSDVWVRRNLPLTSPIPTPSDVVRINSGHEIIGIPFVKVKKLCIADGGTLKSHEGPNVTYGGPLEVQATDYIENKGDIVGKSGVVAETPGASVLLKVGTRIRESGSKGSDYWFYGDGGPFFNLGYILAGDGGDGNQYGASGGEVVILGHNVTSTTTNAYIKAGDGGDILGTQTGKGGKGGLTYMKGKLGGPGYLVNSNGARAYAGDGGNCNPSATETQIGGNGGRIGFISWPRVFLGDGQFGAGKGGRNCTRNGRDGYFWIEPNVIKLSGANTKIEGGDVSIFGGNDWVLDVSGLSGTVVSATGDITMAVGDNGVIDMRGSTGDLFKTEGQVNIFADDVKLDDGVVLSDVIDASNIVVGPSKILRDVSIVGPSASVGEPGVILPVNVTLTNTGPEKDTYNISATGTAGWALGQLPSTFELEALQSVDLVLNVTLPATAGATDVISVTATSQNDPEASATIDAQVSVTNKPSGVVDIDQGIVNVSGVETVVDNGANVSLYATKEDGTIDLRNLAGSKAITATNTITLAVGKDGFIDLRGNKSAVLETTGQVVIFAKESQIRLDDGVQLAELIKASGIVFRTPKSLRAISLTAPSDRSGNAKTIVPLVFTLANDGLEADAYTISVTDSLSLPLIGLPSVKRLKGLESADLLLNVALMTTAGQTEKITITVTSQTDGSVKDIATVSITVGAASATTTGGSTGTTTGGGSGTGTAACPSTGVINQLCSNRGNVIKDFIVESGAAVSGGSVEGTVNNNGMVSQVTVEVGAELIGGLVSGSIFNKGTIRGAKFVGITLEGGILDGVTTNDSQVGGIIRNVRLAKSARIVNGAVGGEITGDPSGPGILENVIVRSGTKLSNVILINVQLGSGISFGSGVRFTDSAQIPDMELMALLPDLSTATLVDGITIDSRPVDFTADVVDPSDGILSVINGLSLFKDNGWALTQNGKWGYFEVIIDNVRYAEIPSSVMKTTEQPDMVVLDAQSLNFITISGLGVLTHPALQAPDALQAALSELFSLTEFTVQTNGNIYVPVAEGEWYSARPDWSSVKLDSEPENVGLSVDISPHVSGSGLASLVFADNEGHYQQNLFPSLADPEALAAVAEDISIEPYGLVNFTLNGKAYRGVVDYLVSQGTETTVEMLQVESIADVNGDGVDDIVLVYPNGDRQIVIVVE